MLKLVKYRIIFVKREYEASFFEHEDVIDDNLDGSALWAWILMLRLSLWPRTMRP